MSDGTLLEGTVLDGRYRLDQLLGRGGTAEVYRATDQLLGRQVAVKVFDTRLTDLNSVERQQTEMRALASLDHPNLVAVHDARIARRDDTDDAPDRTYLVLELVNGITLAELLHAGALPHEQTRRIGEQLAQALSFVHSLDFVHRDVKPANVLLAGNGQIKLGDFGLARLLTAEERVTTGSDVMGTAAYLSPEQAAAKEVRAPVDVYALGLLLLECLTGRREFPGEPVQAALARLLRDPVIPTDLPEPWPTLLTSMTASVPSARPTAARVAEVLSGDFEVRRTVTGRQVLIAAGSALVGAVALIGALVMAQPATTPTKPFIGTHPSITSSAPKLRATSSRLVSSAPVAPARLPSATAVVAKTLGTRTPSPASRSTAAATSTAPPSTAPASTAALVTAPPTAARSSVTATKAHGSGNGKGKGQTKAPKKPKG